MDVEIIYDDTHLFLQSVFIIAIEGSIKIIINLEKNPGINKCTFERWKRGEEIFLIQEGCNNIKTIQKCKFLNVHKIYMKNSVYIFFKSIGDSVLYRTSQNLIDRL